MRSNETRWIIVNKKTGWIMSNYPMSLKKAEEERKRSWKRFKDAGEIDTMWDMVIVEFDETEVMNREYPLPLY